MDIECQPFGIFEVFSHPQEVESIDTDNLSSSVWLEDIIMKLVMSNVLSMT